MADMIIANPGLAQSDKGKDRLGLFENIYR